MNERKRSLGSASFGWYFDEFLGGICDTLLAFIAICYCTLCMR